ncbi:hypothetical protein MM236_19035 [Belliella sp. DSM 107340]|uniref:Uncharacterized protein n=1 Tax=Belliella calami TaxID=2923436 RepID=A0ABS9UTZ5_9BACT|nr:hypothetical protein [Belliella calami]MCH7400098.1 hypothetical protein [Belliella calami]
MPKQTPEEIKNEIQSLYDEIDNTNDADLIRKNGKKIIELESKYKSKCKKKS